MGYNPYKMKVLGFHGSMYNGKDPWIFFVGWLNCKEAMPTEEELKQFGAKPPEEAAPPPEARTVPRVLSLWEMIIGKSSIPKTATFFCVF